jgi:multiple antibiotic resistance protein
MPDVLAFASLALTTLFLIVDPLAIVPIFATLTQGRSPEEIRRIARRATGVGAAILVAFAVGGRYLLDALGVSLEAFRAAGGLLLLFVAFEMVRGRPPSCRCSQEELADAQAREDIAIVPVATPLLAGPGAIAAVMMLLSRESAPWALPVIVGSIAVVFAAAYVTLRSAPWVQRLLGVAGLAVAQRLLGLLLAAMALQSIAANGIALVRLAGLVSL